MRFHRRAKASEAAVNTSQFLHPFSVRPYWGQKKKSVATATGLLGKTLRSASHAGDRRARGRARDGARSKGEADAAPTHQQRQRHKRHLTRLPPENRTAHLRPHRGSHRLLRALIEALDEDIYPGFIGGNIHPAAAASAGPHRWLNPPSPCRHVRVILFLKGKYWPYLCGKQERSDNWCTVHLFRTEPACSDGEQYHVPVIPVLCNAVALLLFFRVSKHDPPAGLNEVSVLPAVADLSDWVQLICLFIFRFVCFVHFRVRVF